jgi:putative ABC transport system permease protein
MSGYYFSLALKGLWRTPWLALLMVITLAVGVSANMVIITLRHALAMDPIPGKSERLLQLQLQNPAIPQGMGGWVTYAEAEQLRRLGAGSADSVETGNGDVDAISVGERRIVIDSGLGVRYATAGFFQMFDVPLKSGRIWTREEEQNAAPVAILAQDMAKRLFPGTSPIGRQVGIGDTLYTVIGVSGPWFPQPHYIDMTLGAFGVGGDRVFLPVTAIRYAPSNMRVYQSMPRFHPQRCLPAELLASKCNWLSVWYLAPTEREVWAFTQAVKSQLPQIFPVEQARELELLNVRQIVADVVPAEVNRYSWLGLVFLALCVVNASGMQLSRLMRGTSQIGIRRALGASRMDIVRQYLCDALLVGGVGGLLGVGLTFGGLYFVRGLSLDDARYTNMAQMDATMFGMMILLIFVCSVVAGVVPAWLASRADPARIIKVAQ